MFSLGCRHGSGAAGPMKMMSFRSLGYGLYRGSAFITGLNGWGMVVLISTGITTGSLLIKDSHDSSVLHPLLCLEI